MSKKESAPTPPDANMEFTQAEIAQALGDKDLIIVKLFKKIRFLEAQLYGKNKKQEQT